MLRSNFNKGSSRNISKQSVYCSGVSIVNYCIFFMIVMVSLRATQINQNKEFTEIVCHFQRQSETESFWNVCIFVYIDFPFSFFFFLIFLYTLLFRKYKLLKSFFLVFALPGQTPLFFYERENKEVVICRNYYKH